MSISLNELEPYKVIDPRVNVKEASKYLFRQGANITTNQTITATSSSASKTSFRCNPPSPHHIMSRLVYVEMKYLVSILATAEQEGQNVTTRVPVDITQRLPGKVGDDRNYVCLRQFPIASVTRALTVNINSDTLTQEPYRYIHALARFHLCDDLRENALSSSPAQPDPYQKYNDGFPNAKGQAQVPELSVDSAGNGGGGFGFNYGGDRSPFLDYGRSAQEIPRASYTFDNIRFDNTVDSPTRNTTVFEVTVTEPLFISPLSGGSSNQMGLTHINTMNVDLSWDSKLERILSVDYAGLTTAQQNALVAIDGRPATKANTFRIDGINVTPAEASQCKILFTYFTPQPTIKIPRNLSYDFNELKVFTKDMKKQARPVVGTTLGAKFSDTIVSDQISLMSIPNKVYIFVRPKESSRSAFTTDCFAEITTLAFQFNNSAGLFTSASESDLWRMSVSNGLKMSYPQWKDYTGSVLCIDFGRDIGLQPTQCVGMLGQFNMQFTLGYNVLNTQQLEYELVTVVDYTGVYHIRDQQITRQIGIITPQDVLEASDYNEIDGEEMEKLHGGTFMHDMKSVYSKAKTLKPYAKKAVKAAEVLEPVISTLAPRAGPALKKGLSAADKLLGMGYTKQDIKEMRAQGYTNGDFKNIVAGNTVGGAHYPKSKMMQRISSYR